MALIRPKDLDTKSTLASTDEVMLDGDTTGSMPRDTFIAQVAALIVASPSTYKLATLDGADKLTSSQDPSQAVSYIGTHNVSTNSPALIDGTGTAGDTYQVNVAGTRDYGSGSLTLAVGDALVYSGTVWQQVSGVANILDGISTPAAAQTALEVVSRDEYSRGVGTKIVGPAISLDGTNDYIEIADSDKLSFTDGADDLPFSVGGWVKMDDATNFTIASKYNTPNTEYIFRVNGTDNLSLGLYTDASNVWSFTADDALTSYEGQWVHVAVVYGGSGPNSDNAFSAATASFYVNGALVSSTDVQLGTYAGMSNTAQPVWLGRFQSTYANGQLKDVKLFNRELTASEVTSLYNEGQLGFADEWGEGHGDTYTSDFSSTVDSWIGSNTTVSQASGPVVGRNNLLQITANAGSATHSGKRITTAEVGKRYRVEFDYYITSGNSHVDGLKARFDNGTYQDLESTLDAWTRVSFETVATSAILEIYQFDGASQVFDDPGGDDSIWIDAVKVTQIGTLLDARAENFNVASGKLIDLSDNGFIGVNNGASAVGGKKHVQASSLDLTGIPTSSAGLSAGEVYSNSGVLTIV